MEAVSVVLLLSLVNWLDMGHDGHYISCQDLCCVEFHKQSQGNERCHSSWLSLGNIFPICACCGFVVEQSKATELPKSSIFCSPSNVNQVKGFHVGFPFLTHNQDSCRVPKIPCLPRFPKLPASPMWAAGFEGFSVCHGSHVLTDPLGNGSLDLNFLVEMKLGFPLNSRTATKM